MPKSEIVVSSYGRRLSAELVTKFVKMETQV